MRLPPSTKEIGTSHFTEQSTKSASPFNSHFLESFLESSFLSSEKAEHFPKEYFALELFNAIAKLVYIFPFWSGILLQRKGKTNDTNADVENWFGIVRNSILKKEKNLQPSEFIRKLHVHDA